jgi:ribonuclease HI
MEETKGTVNKYGVVIYSDGGARPNPGYGGGVFMVICIRKMMILLSQLLIKNII